MGHDRIAGSENAVGAEVLADLRLQRGLDIDLGEDAEAVLLQGRAGALDDRLEVAFDGAGMKIGHDVWSSGLSR